MGCCDSSLNRQGWIVCLSWLSDAEWAMIEPLIGGGLVRFFAVDGV